MFDTDKALIAAFSKLGTSYKFGAKWSNKDIDPRGPIDCSGFVVWVFSQGGVELIDGSDNQYHASYQVGKIKPGLLGFFKKADTPCHHVGIVYDNDYVIEARGSPYNKVILRPVSKWENWKEFTGWRQPFAVDKANGLI